MNDKTAKPTASELAILRILWDLGPSTVRSVFEVMRQERAVGYTGVLKLMQIMAAKGSVDRDESSRAHIYSAREAPSNTKRKVAGDLLQQVFGGSPSQLVLHLLDDKQATPAEIAEIRRMLDEYERVPK